MRRLVGDVPEFLRDSERRFLVALNELGVRYMIVGMSAALLLGARGATEDIDLWFENLGDPASVRLRGALEGASMS
jgi:hypothetical protein